jgi:type IV secretory pathway VirB6-like protein
MNNFLFWQRWLLILAILFVVLGIVMTLSFGANLFDTLINPVFWANGAMPNNVYNFKTFIYGVLGASMVGWGMLFAFIVYYPFRQKEKWAWNSLLAGFTLWFVFGLYVSFRAGVYANIVGDVVFFVLVMAPLFFTRKDFFHSQEGQQ